MAKGQDWIEQAAFEIAASSDSSTTAEIAAIIQKHCPREIDVEVQVARPADTPTPAIGFEAEVLGPLETWASFPDGAHTKCPRGLVARLCAAYRKALAAPLPPAVAPAPSPVRDGYYWYTRGEGDYGDLDSDRTQIVEVTAGRVFVMGGDLSTPMDEAHGQFTGPILPPASTARE